MKLNNTESIHFKIDKNLKIQLEKQAKKSSLKVSAYLRILILEDIRNNQFEYVKRRGEK